MIQSSSTDTVNACLATAARGTAWHMCGNVLEWLEGMNLKGGAWSQSGMIANTANTNWMRPYTMLRRLDVGFRPAL